MIVIVYHWNIDLVDRSLAEASQVEGHQLEGPALGIIKQTKPNQTKINTQDEEPQDLQAGPSP